MTIARIGRISKVAKAVKVTKVTKLFKTQTKEKSKEFIGVYCPCNPDKPIRWNYCSVCRPSQAIAHQNRTNMNFLVKKDVDKEDLQIIQGAFYGILKEANMFHLRRKDLSSEQWKYIYPKVNVILKKTLNNYSVMKFKNHNVYGCDFRFFIFNISRQLKPGWKIHQNRKGIWDIDHKIPCASFDLTKEKYRKQCFYFTNYKPMDSMKNKQKGCKVN